jgi:hypothetical protein
VAFGDLWNTRVEDQQGEWVCDAGAPSDAAALYRAVDIDAPIATVWRWLCQLRVAPYSYDWIDNRGRESPSTLTPGLDRLEVGQPVMSIFRLTRFAVEDHLTLEVAGFLGLGPLRVTYRVREHHARTRLAVKLSVGRRHDWVGSVLLRALAVGDWIMMRKQLLTLKRHAEAAAEASSSCECEASRKNRLRFQYHRYLRLGQPARRRAIHAKLETIQPTRWR